MKIILSTLLILFINNAVFLQNTQDSTIQHSAVDRIIMTNGEIKEGKVASISDVSIDFIHSGETLVYHIPINKIGKIEFSSGRIEQFNPIKADKKSDNSMVNHTNKIAVLPFIYVKDGTQRKNDIMEKNAQKELYKILVDHAGPMVIQDPMVTVDLLRKNKITDANISTFSVPELANILGVEYIVFSVLTVNLKGTTSYSTGYGSTYYNHHNAYGYRSSSTSTQLDYQTTVSVNVFNDHGQNIFKQNKTSFFASQDAYPYTIMYLVKRMPFYTK